MMMVHDGKKDSGLKIQRCEDSATDAESIQMEYSNDA